MYFLVYDSHTKDTRVALSIVRISSCCKGCLSRDRSTASQSEEKHSNHNDPGDQNLNSHSPGTAPVT